MRLPTGIEGAQAEIAQLLECINTAKREKDELETQTESPVNQQHGRDMIQQLKKEIQSLQDQYNELWRRQSLENNGKGDVIRCYVEEQYNQIKNRVERSLTEKGFDCTASGVEGGYQSLQKSIDRMKNDLIRLETEKTQTLIKVSQDEGILSILSSRKETIQLTISKLEEEVKNEYSSLNVVFSASLESYNSLLIQLQSHHTLVFSHYVYDLRSLRM